MKKKSTKKEILVAAVLGVVLLLLAIGIIMLLLSGSVKKTKSVASNSSTEEDTASKESAAEEDTSVQLALEGFSAGSVVAPSEEVVATPTVAPTVEPGVDLAGEYLIADSNSRLITAQDLDLLSKEDVARARNEIYARHGRMFDSEELQTYFGSKSWYVPLYTADLFSEDMLNEIEKENAKFIRKYEEEKGYR